ncbi:MAG: leucyl/phenylalanyl-tRNA--protein transferase [Vicinamibacterales bacterium]
MLPPSLLVAAYQAGYFPMAMEDGEIRWYSPDPRGVLPLDRFHAPRRLLRVVRSRRFEISIDRAFRGVMEGCAADREDGTWIDGEILASYAALHELGLAHSVEVWDGGELVGGLYGVSLGGAFFGESMFHRVSDASKVALWALIERLRQHAFALLDIQWLTPFLASCGAVEIPRDQYLGELGAALDVDTRF